MPLDGYRGSQTVERPRWTAMDARSGDLNFRGTSTLTPERSNWVTSTFSAGVAGDSVDWGQNRGKNRGKTTSTFYHDGRFTRTIVRKSSSKTLERGTGLEPATSTLGTRGQPATVVNRRPRLVLFKAKRSSGVHTSPHPSVGKSWEHGKTLRSLRSVCRRRVGVTHVCLATNCGKKLWSRKPIFQSVS